MATYPTPAATGIFTPPAVPATPPLTQADKVQIISDVLTSYLRTNWVTGDTLTVCEEFIAQANQAARAAAATASSQTSTHP
jgi:hypothetical protein